MDFEKNLKEIEKISEDISSGTLGLKESIENFKRGLKLIDMCKKELNEVENSVKKLVSMDETSGDIKTEDLNLENGT
ncbi:MAG: exodeoxyribonuclease VII small subunit [Bdellovibrionales bacterium]|nr:exodeoxyribonuclease VII small subunit [Bdellovibrionales bacterium]